MPPSCRLPSPALLGISDNPQLARIVIAKQSSAEYVPGSRLIVSRWSRHSDYARNQAWPQYPWYCRAQELPQQQ